MKLAERKLLRVAAYARVSCDKDEMKHSLAAQISYYNEYIQRRSDWPSPASTPMKPTLARKMTVRALFR